MNGKGLRLAETASDLRRAFDRSFAETPREMALPGEDFLAIRLAADPYALRLSEIAGLYADRRVIPVPSRALDLLGIAAFRGVIVPVYDLRTLLGYSPSAPPRWLVLAAKAPVAFAFDTLDRHLRMSRDAIVTDGEVHREHVREIARAPEARPIVQLASVLEAVGRHAREIATREES